MITTDKTGVQLVLEKCITAGMKTVVCSPGSRNAPIVIAADEHPDIETLVIHDERVASFYALGIALATGAPVGITCTSGSAMLNYYPAIAEAYYQCVPLIVLSADRPEEWVNHGDGQTIVQKGVYTNHTHGEITVPEYLGSDSNIVSDIESLVNKAIGPWKGPVHFNFPFTEPLYNTVEVDRTPAAKISFKEMVPDRSLFSSLEKDWNDANKIMIIVGQMSPDGYTEKLLNDLSQDPSVCILVENTSNVSGFRLSHCIDRSLNLVPDDERSEYEPDLLITIGGAVISKKIKAFLRSIKELNHYRIGFDFPEMDTYRHLKEHIACEPDELLKLISSDAFRKYSSNFGSKWKQLDFIVKDKQTDYLENIPFSDYKVFHYINQFLPEGTNIHMSNSSVVRYCQLFDPIKDAQYYCNRGTSGIDGSTSTAFGVSFATSDKLNVLLTGDISFFYDSNAFWTKYLGGNIRVILINNSGGGIFRIIDGPSSTNQLEKYFEATHDQSAEHICQAFNVKYLSASDEEKLERALLELFGPEETDRPVLLEVKTDRNLNDSVLKKFFADSRSWK